MKKSIARTCIGMICSSVIRNIFGNSAPAVAILLLSFLMGMSISAHALPKVTLENLIDENRLHSAPTDANAKKQSNDLKGILEVLDTATSTSFELKFHATYTKPIVFAGQLTAKDNIVSILRYYTSGANKINIFKLREMSGCISANHIDQMGWMAMDLVLSQPGVVLNSKVSKQNYSVAFYPNPANYILYFNFTRSNGVEIIKLARQILFESDVLQSSDKSSLTAGLYILKADGVII